MKKTAGALAILLLTITGCNSSGPDPDNLLLGKWKAVSGDPGCDATMDFEKTQASFVDFKGNSRSMAVTYVAANQDKMPTTVYVITDAGMSNHTTWNFSDKNTVQLDAYTMCTYKRQ